MKLFNITNKPNQEPIMVKTREIALSNGKIHIEVVDDNQEVTAEMIHNEFNSAGDRLYQEALAIINSTVIPNQNKAERLQKMGFTATGEATEARRQQLQKEASMEKANLVKYFRDKYPLYKFIHEDDVTIICEKYGLIVGRASAYEGFVPDRNLREIEAFKIDEKDRRIVRYRGWFAPEMPLSFSDTKSYWATLEAENDFKKAKSNQDKIDYMKQNAMMVNSIFSSTQGHAVISELRVAAPQSDFKISAFEEVKDHRIVTKAVPDPVVLCPVPEGYLIVTAWGDEASDPIVQNELNN